MISDAVTVPVRMEAMMRRICDQWARIRATLIRLAIIGSRPGIGRRLGEAVQAAVLEVRDARRELEAQQAAEGEDVVGIATAVGVVPPRAAPRSG